MRAVLIIALLAGCEPLPLVPVGEAPVQLAVYPMPACLIFCTAHISAIRDTAQVNGDGSFTEGTNSNSSSSSSEQGGSG
jgi:hypothetical protein